jgi:hypothetical protein
MTLTARVFLLVALAAAPTSALLIFDNYQRLQQREADAEQEALRSTRLVSAELDQIFKGIESLLRAAAQTPMVSAFQNPECTDYLRRLEGINPNAGRLVAVDATGQVRCGATARLTGVADRDYFHAALKSDDLVVGGYTIGRGSGAPILPLAVRFETSEGTGVLVSGLRLDWLREHFSRIFGAFPARSSLTIVDRDGIILVRLPMPTGPGNRCRIMSMWFMLLNPVFSARLPRRTRTGLHDSSASPRSNRRRAESRSRWDFPRRPFSPRPARAPCATAC